MVGQRHQQCANHAANQGRGRVIQKMSKQLGFDLFIGSQWQRVSSSEKTEQGDLEKLTYLNCQCCGCAQRHGAQIGGTAAICWKPAFKR